MSAEPDAVAVAERNGPPRPRPASGTPAGTRSVGSARGTALAFALYLVVSSVFFGRQALAHLGSVVIAPNDIDSSQYQWFLAWWPHAILHGLNPFVTHAVYVPEGYNLTWTTSLAGPAILLSPITLLFGPTVAFNLFAILAPAVSALTAFLLCRHITRSPWPSLLGGYVFGFSGFVLTTVQGEPWLAFVALVPAVALLVLKRLDGELRRRTFIGLIAGAVVVQFLTSAEVLTTATLFGGLVVALAAALFRERRRELLVLVGELAAAFVIAIVVLSPFLYYMLKPHTSPLHATLFVGPTDPIAFFVPGSLLAGGTWLAARWGALGLPPTHDTFAYLGLPLLAIAFAYMVGERHRRSARLLTICFAVGILAVMGTRLIIAGHDTGVALPWALLTHIPLIRYALPFRTAIYAALVGAVILASWLATRPRALPWAVAMLAVAALVPSLSSPYWHSDAVDPPFFRTGEYRAYLSHADNVLTVPVDGQNQRWQARSGFAFNIVGGYLGAFPTSYTRFVAWNALLNGVRPPHWPEALRAYLAAKHATVIVIDKGVGARWRPLFASLHITPVDTGGVLVYRLKTARRS